jgi:hypothetical protein
MTLVAAVASTMSGHDSPFLPVTFRGSSHGNGCREFYNSTTGEIDRVRMTSEGSAYWVATVPRRQKFVVVSLTTCAVRLAMPAGFAVKSDANQKEVKVELEPGLDCSSPHHFREVQFGLEVPEDWSSPDIRFQVEHTGIRFQVERYYEKYEMYFRDFTVRVYQD